MSFSRSVGAISGERGRVEERGMFRVRMGRVGGREKEKEREKMPLSEPWQGLPCIPPTACVGPEVVEAMEEGMLPLAGRPGESGVRTSPPGGC